jgi:hypothetical protein
MAKSGSEREKYPGDGQPVHPQTQQLFGSGPEWDTWRPEYDKLMRSIQRAQNQKPVGLDDPTVARPRDRRSPGTITMRSPNE